MLYNTNEWFNIGNNSLKVIGSKWMRLTCNINSSGNFLFSGGVCTKDNTVRAVLYNSSSNFVAVDIPPNTDRLIELHIKVYSIIELYVNFFILNGNDNFYYLDNLCLRQ